MDERQALERAIAAHPDEDTPRLIYADWLDEHGQTGPAARLRWWVDARRQIPPTAGWDEGWSGWLTDAMLFECVEACDSVRSVYAANHEPEWALVLCGVEMQRRVISVRPPFLTNWYRGKDNRNALSFLMCEYESYAYGLIAGT